MTTDNNQEQIRYVVTRGAAGQMVASGPLSIEDASKKAEFNKILRIPSAVASKEELTQMRNGDLSLPAQKEGSLSKFEIASRMGAGNKVASVFTDATGELVVGEFVDPVIKVVRKNAIEEKVGKGKVMMVDLPTLIKMETGEISRPPPIDPRELKLVKQTFTGKESPGQVLAVMTQLLDQLTSMHATEKAFLNLMSPNGGVNVIDDKPESSVSSVAFDKQPATPEFKSLFNTLLKKPDNNSSKLKPS